MWQYIENIVGSEVVSRRMPMKETQESDSDTEVLLEKMVNKNPCLSKVIYFVGGQLNQHKSILKMHTWVG